MKPLFKSLPQVFFLFLIVNGCDRGTGSFALVKTIPGGCAAKTTEKGVNTADSSGVTCSVKDGYLNIKVGFMGGCCEPYTPSYKTDADTLLLKLDSDANNGYCNCLCLHSYTYVFKGSWTNHYYHVLIDGFLYFTGKINP